MRVDELENGFRSHLGFLIFAESDCDRIDVGKGIGRTRSMLLLEVLSVRSSCNAQLSVAFFFEK